MHNKYDEVQEMLDTYKEQLPEPKEEWPHDVQRAVEFIHEHFFDPQLTVTWLRKKCRITGKSFPGVFRRCTKCYPKAYILHHRIEAGKLLLKQTEATVTEIALAVGFRSLSSFCKTFKDREELKPSRWRRKAKDVE